MKNKSIKIKLFCIVSFSLMGMYSLAQGGIEGVYSYNTANWVEEIHLYQDGTFMYYKGHCPSRSSMGNYTWGKKFHIIDSNLVLNTNFYFYSIIDENYKRKNDSITFFVNLIPMDCPEVGYNLYIITESGDTLLFYKNTVEVKIKIQERIKAFWVEDIITKAKTGLYKVKSYKSNIFLVFFDRRRTFDNEEWLIIDSTKIQPRGVNGVLQDYYLIKEDTGEEASESPMAAS